MKKLFLPLAALAMFALPMTADAAACRDAHGKFTTCGSAAAVKAKPKVAAPMAAKPQPATVHVAKAAPAKTAAKRCKIAGKFASCSKPGAKPA